MYKKYDKYSYFKFKLWISKSIIITENLKFINILDKPKE